MKKSNKTLEEILNEKPIIQKPKIITYKERLETIKASLKPL